MDGYKGRFLRLFNQSNPFQSFLGIPFVLYCMTVKGPLRLQPQVIIVRSLKLIYVYGNNSPTQCRPSLISNPVATSPTREVFSRCLALVTPFAVLEKVGERNVSSLCNCANSF